MNFRGKPLTDDERLYLRHALSVSKPRRLFVYEGRAWSLGEIAKLTGMKPGTLHKRVAVMGMCLDDALRAPVPMPCKQRKCRTFEFRGKQLTAKEIARITGKSVGWVYYNNDGIKIVEPSRAAYHDPETHPHWPTYFHAGIRDTLSGWSRRVGIPRSTLCSRLGARGWSIKRALTTPVDKRSGRHRHAKSIREMIATINASIRADRRAPVSTSNAVTRTRGYAKTFSISRGTGAGRHLRDLQSEKMNG